MLIILADATTSAGHGVSMLPSILIPVIICGAIGLLVYFIPAILAFKNNKVNKVAILLLNIFLGWTLIGWVVALVWAVTKDQTTKI